MKRLILCAALAVGTTGAGIAQTYQNDYQKVVGLSKNSMVNYTLCETADKGYATVSFIERGNSPDQNRIQLTKLDANLNVEVSHAFDYNATGLYSFEITPFDIYEAEPNLFVIAGGLINEGNSAQSGGFLLSVKLEPKQQFIFNWMQIYPNDYQPGFMSIQEIRRVVKVGDGYMAIARGQETHDSGVLLKTDNEGNMQWAQHLFGTEYKGNNHSVLADMVVIDKEQVAVVGTVNGFPNDDADIQVVRVSSAGKIISHHIYEFQGELKDPKYTYYEQGAAIEYKADQKELIVAGTAMKKVEGVCVAAEYKEILTFGVDLSTGKPTWSTRHDIGADPTYSLESFYCADIDFGQEGYAVAGTVKNRLNTKSTHYNGFILRLNAKYNATNVRYYGADQHDFLSRIYNKGNVYVAGGMLNKGNKNLNWLIESYPSVKQDCLSKRAEAKSNAYPLIAIEGSSRKVEVNNHKTNMKMSKSPFVQDPLCEKVSLSGTISTQKEPSKATISKK